MTQAQREEVKQIDANFKEWVAPVLEKGADKAEQFAKKEDLLRPLADYSTSTEQVFRTHLGQMMQPEKNNNFLKNWH